MARECKTISDFLQSRIDAGDFPSAVYLVAEKGEIVFHEALGYAVVEPERIPAKLDTIYDLASLTKPLVTGLLSATQINAGKLELEVPIGGMTVEQLITHTSGLPSWMPIFALVDSPAEVVSFIKRQRRDEQPTVEYSDLGFILLASSSPEPRIEAVFEECVMAPLGLTRTSFNPLEKGFDLREIAASENGNDYERQMCVERGYAIRNLQSAIRNLKSAI